MRGRGRKRVGSVTLGLVIALVSLLPVTAEAARRSRAERYRIGKQQLERANRLRADLQGTPKNRRKESNYLKTIRLYRRVYDIAPFHSIAATALATAAEMYHDMGRQFGRKYWLKSMETYKFLRREYPYSRYGDDALFNIAQIQYIHLKDTKTALASYEAFLKSYPRSRYAAKARNAIRNIKAQRTAARKPPKKPPGKRVQVRNIRYWNTKNYTRVVVDLEGEVRYQGARIANPDRIFFDLFDTELSHVLGGKSFDVADGLLNRVRVAENRAGVTRVVLEVSNAQDYSVFSLPNPFRLVVDIRGRAPTRTARKVSAKKPSPTSKKPKESETARASLPRPPPVPKPTREGNHTLSRALGLKISRIVLDPGHGGHDTGTIGPSGFMEKDLALDVARRLGRLLEGQLGANVIYTREDDTFVPLENRIALANEKQADLFLSIHANSSRSRRVRGTETFYLNFTSDPEVLKLAARENALSQKSVHELQDLVRKITDNEKLSESRELAREIQKHLHQEMRKLSRRLPSRGVKQAPFVVLLGANMPSVLTEVAFLSNPTDEKLLKSPKGRQAVAEALFAGMSKYLENFNSLASVRPAEQSPAPQQ
ncbi:MAG: N-acetylmuramoyl-L-alanine amidase [Terriglobia bacterium]